LIERFSIQPSTLELIAAVFLVAVGGYGDAASFLLVHCFTGHVTGNTVLAAIGLTSKGGHAWQPLLAVFSFLSATALAQKLRSASDSAMGSKGFRYILVLETILLCLGPWLLTVHAALLIAAMCLALGLQNGALSKAGGIGLHTTYLSGTLTHFLSLLVQPGNIGNSTTPLAAKFIPVAACAFVAGALCGSLMIVDVGPKGLWGMPLLLAVVFALSFLSPPPPSGARAAEGL
jgi:uncharacterized membrane protein YoaK (UPF0700 family)